MLFSVSPDAYDHVSGTKKRITQTHNKFYKDGKTPPVHSKAIKKFKAASTVLKANVKLKGMLAKNRKKELAKGDGGSSGDKQMGSPVPGDAANTKLPTMFPSLEQGVWKAIDPAPVRKVSLPTVPKRPPKDSDSSPRSIRKQKSTYKESGQNKPKRKKTR